MSKFKAGDKVVALKGFHTIKIGDILTVENPDEYWFHAEECRGYTLNVANYELYKPEFKNMKGMFSNMKFRVNSPEHSKEIQEALFEMGYKWYGQEVVEMVDSEYSFMYSYEDGTITHSPKHYMYMEDTHSQEYLVETTKSYKLIPVEIPKSDVITIDGKTYDKEAVLKRLAELKAI